MILVCSSHLTADWQVTCTELVFVPFASILLETYLTVIEAAVVPYLLKEVTHSRVHHIDTHNGCFRRDGAEMRSYGFPDCCPYVHTAWWYMEDKKLTHEQSLHWGCYKYFINLFIIIIIYINYNNFHLDTYILICHRLCVWVVHH